MPQFILHVGSGKTGTSYIQAALSLNEKLLARHNIYYPRSPKHDIAVSGGITGGNGQRIANILNGKIFIGARRDALGVDAEEAVSSAEGKDILFSAESMQFLTEEGLIQLKKSIEQAGYVARVIIYVRDVADAAYSSYNQDVKRGGFSGTFTEFLSKYYLIFARTIRIVNDVLGADAVDVRNYNRKKAILLEDFRAALGLSVSLRAPPQSVINRSLDLDELVLMREFNKRIGSLGVASRVSDAIIYGAPDVNPRVLITGADVELMRHKFSADVAYVNSFLPADQCISVGQAIASASDSEKQVPEVSQRERALISIISMLLTRQRV